jgi:hypothetical protein
MTLPIYLVFIYSGLQTYNNLTAVKDALIKHPTNPEPQVFELQQGDYKRIHFRIEPAKVKWI